MVRVLGGVILVDLSVNYTVEEGEVVHQELRDEFAIFMKDKYRLKAQSKRSERNEWLDESSHLNVSSDHYVFPRGTMTVGMIAIENQQNIVDEIPLPVNVQINLEGSNWDKEDLVNKIKKEIFSSHIETARSLSYDVED
ncbi:hypothetical protein CMO88_02460 [Candidatus Woesearchaeota archaeon]|nr:hypothetical protein [Candidatus Woesearchaeota archaeon]|tara:strand:- start:8195 stop:8611 length:417 start_codon:yes stop_codon:yes gene_type:complete